MAGPAFEFDGQPAIAPGEVLRLMGTGIGPSAVTAGTVSQSRFVTSNVAGVSVAIGGVAAPLLSVNAAEIDCIAPFEISNQTTVSIQVEYNGTQSNVVLAQVLPTFIQILGVFNSDFTAILPRIPRCCHPA